ncbi:MAG TPA: dihydropteroate synthase [Acidimicrobiia bacterium]|nr:dihydropteroate synthase [Acidimicrobiia bacterium]
MDSLKIAMLGCGVVGSEVARLLTEHSEDLAARVGRPLELAGIAVRRPGRDRGHLPVDPALFTSDAHALVTRGDIDIVIEVIGGIEPARSLVLAALEAGASVVNDITAGRGDPRMLPLVAEAGAGYVFMHMQGTPATMQLDPRYDDVVAEVGAFLAGRRAAANDAGIGDDRLVADPGLGFGKTVTHNLALLARLDDIARAAGVPVLVGPSRKGFIGVAGGAPGDPLPVDEREDGTLAAVVWALDHGASMVRVHDVAPAVEAIRVLRAVAAATPTDPDPPVSWRPPVPIETTGASAP